MGAWSKVGVFTERGKLFPRIGFSVGAGHCHANGVRNEHARASRAALIHIQPADNREREGASDCQEEECADGGVSALP